MIESYWLFRQNSVVWNHSKVQLESSPRTPYHLYLATIQIWWCRSLRTMLLSDSLESQSTSRHDANVEWTIRGKSVHFKVRYWFGISLENQGISRDDIDLKWLLRTAPLDTIVVPLEQLRAFLPSNHDQSSTVQGLVGTHLAGRRVVRGRGCRVGHWGGAGIRVPLSRVW